MACNDPERRREHNRRYYDRHKQEHIARVRELKRKQREVVRKFIDEVKDNPCTDCGNRFPPCVMDFDHLDPKQKKFGIASGSTYTVERLKEEIAKCELVCANCHRIRTHKRRRPNLGQQP